MSIYTYIVSSYPGYWVKFYFSSIIMMENACRHPQPQGSRDSNNSQYLNNNMLLVNL